MSTSSCAIICSSLPSISTSCAETVACHA
jgi:hypothetical protein